MKKSTIILIIVVVAAVAMVLFYNSDAGKAMRQSAFGDHGIIEDLPVEGEPVKTKHYTAQEQKLHDKVAATNNLSKENIIKEARKSMLTGGLSGIVNSANNVTSAINKLFKKKR